MEMIFHVHVLVERVCSLTFVFTLSFIYHQISSACSYQIVLIKERVYFSKTNKIQLPAVKLMKRFAFVWPSISLRLF